MADYQYLTDEDKANIVAQEQAALPKPEDILRAREANHYRSVIRAKVGLNDPPDPYEPIDVTKETADEAVLADEATKLPAPVVIGVNEVVTP